jgi:hypothetical protein
MTGGMSEEEIYQLAKKRVEEKKGFYTHLIVYVCVNALLVVIWAVTGAGFPWFVFPLGGWGIGLIFHFLGTFVFSGRMTTDWERKEIEKEVERLKK